MMPSNERAVRKQRVDKALANAGWRVVDYARWQSGHRTAADAVEEFPTDSGPGDYMLFLEGHPVADVEAKKLEVGPQNVIEQAKRYARTLPDSPTPLAISVSLLYTRRMEARFTRATCATFSITRAR